MGAYLIWGVMPLYLRLLHGVPAQDVLAHRILWSVLVVVAGRVGGLAVGRAAQP